MDFVRRQTRALRLYLACGDHTSPVDFRGSAFALDFLVAVSDDLRSSLARSTRYRGSRKFIQSRSAIHFCRLQSCSLARQRHCPSMAVGHDRGQLRNNLVALILSGLWCPNNGGSMAHKPERSPVGATILFDRGTALVCHVGWFCFDCARCAVLRQWGAERR